jgi:hypothetical protein
MGARDGGLWAERLAEKPRHLKEAGKLWNSGVPGVVNKPSRPCLQTLGFSSGKPYCEQLGDKVVG